MKMPEVSYQKILNYVLPTLPDNWTKLRVYAAFMEDTCDLKYFVRNNTNQYFDCFQFVSDYDKLLSILASIYKETAIIRDQLSEEERWSIMTLCVNADGSFQANYDYSDNSESSEAQFDKWKKRHLN